MPLLRLHILLLALSLPLWSQSVTLPDSFVAKVIAVEDGDTIKVLYNGKPTIIRLAHIDCPEIKKQQPFGRNAKQFTSDACFGKYVMIQHSGKYDRFRRMIAVVIDDKGQNLNKALVHAGLAWHFKKYSSDMSYARLEQEARATHRGLWADNNPVAPWIWRKP